VSRRRILITGITGQDGSILAKQMLDEGYEVVGAYRRISSPNFWRLNYYGISQKIKLIPMDITDLASVMNAIKTVKPETVYNLAAQSYVLASFDQPLATAEATGISVLNILEAVLRINKRIKIYNASTSEMFGNGKSNGTYDESSPFHPASPYAAAKTYGYWMSRIYRDSYGIFISNGILFNHESEVRGLEFVTRKISNEVAKIKHKLSDKLILGNLSASRDWGYAPEYTKAMKLIMDLEEPDDFVVATNEVHTVEKFSRTAFKYADLSYDDHISTSTRFLRPKDVDYLKGSYSKINRKTGWKPSVKFDQLVKIMVDADMKRWNSLKKGIMTPTDALFYEENVYNFIDMKQRGTHDSDL
jgi:GDPmannose 4,6-dehydratase